MKNTNNSIFKRSRILLLCLIVALAMIPAMTGCGGSDDTSSSAEKADISIFDNTAWLSEASAGSETWIEDGGQTLEVKVEEGKFKFAYADYEKPEGDNWRTKIIDSVDLSELQRNTLTYHFNDIGGYEGTIKFTMEDGYVVVKVVNGQLVNDNPSEKALQEGTFKLNAYKNGNVDEFVKDSVQEYKKGPDANKNSKKDDENSDENKKSDDVDPIKGYGDSDMDVDSHDSYSLDDAKAAAYSAAKKKAASMEIESWVKNGKNDIWVEYETNDAYLIEVAVYSKLDDGTDFSEGGFVYWYNKYTGVCKFVAFSNEGGEIFVQNGLLDMDTGELKSK